MTNVKQCDIQITKEDVRLALRNLGNDSFSGYSNRCYICPVARGVKRALGLPQSSRAVHVTRQYIQIDGIRYMTNGRIRDIIDSFDADALEGAFDKKDQIELKIKLVPFYGRT
jgi:hypothetical protein